MALLLQAMQASPYVVMAWLTGKNDLMPLMTSVMIWGGGFITLVKLTELAFGSRAVRGKACYRVVAMFVVGSSAYWLLTFHGLQKFGAIAVLSAAIIAAMLQPLISQVLLRAPQHQVGSVARLIVTTAVLLLAGGLILKTRYIGAEREWAAIANVYGIGELLLLGLVQAGFACPIQIAFHYPARQVGP